MNDLDFGGKLYRLRRARQMTQAELAEKLDVSDKTVSKWERNLAFPTHRHMMMLSRILNVSLNELLYGEIIRDSEEYRQHAESNISNLLKTIEKDNKRKAENRWMMIVLVILAVLLLVAPVYPDALRKDESETLRTRMKYVRLLPEVSLTEYYHVHSSRSLISSETGYLIRGSVTCGANNYPLTISVDYDSSTIDSLELKEMFDGIRIYQKAYGDRIVSAFIFNGSTVTLTAYCNLGEQKSLLNLLEKLNAMLICSLNE